MTFTVVVLDPGSQRLLGQDDMLFAPYRSSGDLVTCRWNPSGLTLDRAIPELRERIAGKEDWRLIVVWSDVGTWPETPMQTMETVNPFDLDPGASAEAPALDKPSQQPLVRLTQLVLGYPRLGVKGFQQVWEWPVAVQGASKGTSDGQETGGAEGVTTERSDDPEKIPLEARKLGTWSTAYEETPWTDLERDNYDKLAVHYRHHYHSPRQVILISPRIVDDTTEEHLSDPFVDVVETQASQFVDRNDYPPACRFVVGTIFHPDHVRHDRSRFEFWLGVLTLALNDISSSSLQAYRLFSMAVEVNQVELRDEASQLIGRAQLAQKAIAVAQRFEDPLSFKFEDDVLTRESVPLVFQGLTSVADVQTSRFGLARDCPDDDSEYWTLATIGVHNHIKAYLKAPLRCLRFAGEAVRAYARTFLGKTAALDKDMEDELETGISQLTGEIVAPVAAHLVDADEAFHEIEPSESKVEQLIDARMPRRIVVVAGEIAAVMLVLGFIPWMVTMIRLYGWATLIDTVSGTAAATALALFGGVFMLWWFRRAVRRAIERFNKKVRQVCKEAADSAIEFEQYLSSLATLMKGHAIEQAARNRTAMISAWNTMLRSNEAALIDLQKRQFQLCLDYGYPGAEVRPLDDDDKTYDFTLQDVPKELYQFPVPDSPLMRQGTLGEPLRSPYAFVRGLDLTRVSLYDTTSGPVLVLPMGNDPDAIVQEAAPDNSPVDDTTVRDRRRKQ